MYYQNQIHEKFLRRDTHSSGHLKKLFVRLQLGSSDAAIFFKTDCFGSSSNITFLANIVYRITSVKAPWGNIRDGATGVRNIEISDNIPLGHYTNSPLGNYARWH